MKKMLLNNFGLFFGLVFLVISAIITISGFLVKSPQVVEGAGWLGVILFMVNLPISLLWTFILNAHPIVICVVTPISSALQWYIIGTIIYAISELSFKRKKS